MKTIRLLIAACSIVATGAQAQYGGISYPHGTSILSSAKTTNLNPGFLMGGYQAASTAATPNFVIDRVDINGQFVPPAIAFSRRYDIFDNINCAAPVRKLNCKGVYVIETTDDPTTTAANQVEAYALAGLYKDGLFFAMLDATGAVIPGSTFRWAFTNGIAPVRNPMIIESVANPHRYYICGDQGSVGIATKINTTGVPFWQKIYPQVGEARAMIESPYNANELVIVGNEFGGDAYFMQVNATFGTVTNYKAYGTPNGDDWFTSIEPAASSNGGSKGYIVGGRSLDANNPGNFNFIPWMIKLDPNGNVIWSTLIEPTTPGIITAEINDVFERKSPMAETPYEYYGIAGCTLANGDNMMVWRLDDSGSNVWVFPNEFTYPLGAANSIWSKTDAAQLEFIGDGSNPGDGFQAWSTDYAGGNHVFAKAYYNGVISNGPCNEVIQSAKVHPGPGLLFSGNKADQDLPNVCPNNFSLQSFILNTPAPWCDWNLTVPTGNNNRVTGIEKTAANSENTGVYPNPVNNKALVSFIASDNSQIKIEISNSLGQVVKTVTASKQNAGSYQEEIDFEGLGVNPGVYFINVAVDHTTSSHKIMYLDNK
jgi:hypothetical protein